ncbi:MAG: DUF4233 domain-containing protein [Actinomycetales bacterium]
MLLRSVLSMEIILVGFALLLAKDLSNSSSIWVGLGIMVLTILALGTIKNNLGLILGWIVQFSLVLYGFYVFTMFFMGLLFLTLWVTAIIVGRKGEAIKRANEAKKSD